MIENRKFQYIILTAAGLWILYSTLFIKNTQEQTITAAKEGFAAPGFELTDIDGNLVRLDQYRGKVVLVNLWASWCQPCRAEMPAMESVYRNLKDDGFVILAVNITTQDDKNQAILFARELGLSFPLLLDEEGEVERAYALQGLPTSFFIDQNGIIRSLIIGGPMPESLIYSKVTELLENN